jgi:hypothetical protein
MLLPELGDRHHHREITDMARHTKTKFAALVISFVAALGVVAVSPATGADAGHGAKTSLRGGIDCC